MLKNATTPLSAAYDLAMLDLDGVVYVGRGAVVGAPAHLARARADGMHLAFVTNNASRTPESVAAHLVDLGVEAAPTDVVTSAQAAAHLLAERFGTGARILLLGGDGLDAALRDEALMPVTDPAAQVDAIVSGYGPDVRWEQLMQAGVLIRDGLPWVASNTDLSIPTDYGIGPGHGVQVKMLAEFSGVFPVVAGKPERPLLDETVRRVGGNRPLMVGDRLDTDIEGAHNAGVDSLLVLTGVTGLPELVAAPANRRPTYLSTDLGGLFQPHDPPAVDGSQVQMNGWTTGVHDGELRVAGSGAVDDWWRVVAVAAWLHLDATGTPAGCLQLNPPRAR